MDRYKGHMIMDLINGLIFLFFNIYSPYTVFIECKGINAQLSKYRFYYTINMAVLSIKTKNTKSIVRYSCTVTQKSL